jgi:hypothetical protein
MSLDDMLPYVLPYVGGCPELVAKHHLLLAAREFAARTHCWIEPQDAILAAADTTEYAFNLSEGQEVVKLLALSVGDREFEIVDATTGRRLLRANEGGEFAFTANRIDFTLSPAQSVDAEIVTECALQPAMDVEDLDDDAFLEHATHIGFGAAASLLAMPKQDWSSLDHADRMRARFNDKVSTLGLRVSRGYSASRPRAAANFF